MPFHSVYLRIRQTGVTNSSILLNDIGTASGRGTSDGFPRPQPVYVPAASVAPGYVDVLFTSDVALSFETGAIRGFITSGHIAADLIQGYAGWANYNDAATFVVPMVIPAGIWTTVLNDGLGPQTYENFLPTNVTTFLDTTTGQIITRDLAEGSQMMIRINLNVTPSVNNSLLQIRLYFPSWGGWYLTTSIGRLDAGAGLSYPLCVSFPIYLPVREVTLAGCYVQVFCDNDATAQVQGFYLGTF